MRSRWWWALAALAGIAVLALGYRSALPRTGPAPAMETVRLALPMLPHGALIHIARAKGYFAEEDLDVVVTPVTHGRAALDLVLAGKADLAALAEVPLVISVLNGEDIALAASILSVTNVNRVIARRDRGISSPADLMQKRIGVTFGTNGEYFLWAFLIRHKLAPESVVLVNVPPNEIANSLAQGKVDAAATWQPIVFHAESALGGNGVTFSTASSYTENHIVAGHRNFLARNASAMKKLLRALLKAERLNSARPAEAMSLVAAQLQLDVSALEPEWKDFDFKVTLLQSQLLTLEDEVRWAMARGYVERRPLPNLLPNFHLDALLAVQPDRVTVLR